MSDSLFSSWSEDNTHSSADVSHARDEGLVEALALVAGWLRAHAAGRAVDFYAPSKSGQAALENAASVLEVMAWAPEGNQTPHCREVREKLRAR